MISLLTRREFLCALVALLVAWTGGGSAFAATAVEFNRDVRPILSDRCFACHGPDQGTRMAGLRLDTREGALAERKGGKFPIVPGDPARSEVYRRITSENQALRMPPAYQGHARLSEAEIGVIRQWIEQGAPWQGHWAFLPPRRPELPAVQARDWPRNPIDWFILARLEKEGLKPSPEADRATLIRRAALDLTGLPPDPAAVDGFVADPAPDAYEKLLDRLLASPRYGERMAARWLDAARYADTNGYQSDGVRSMWRWRDWVIDAFNHNMPFDQFTIEQIAGDMLPEAKRSQIIASGFHRNHRTSAEGGIVEEEFRTEYVADRVQTTGTVWLGLTIGCARCHDHKYDPVSQKEFYQLFAYFNNVPERGLVYNFGNEEPFIKAPTPGQEARLAELDRKAQAAGQHWQALEKQSAQGRKAWEKSLEKGEPFDWTVTNGQVLHFSLDGDLEIDTRDCGAQACPPALEPGRAGKAARFDGKRYIDGGDIANFSYLDPFSLAAWIYPTAPNGAILSRTDEEPTGEGYGLYLKEGKLWLHITRRWTDISLRLETAERVELNRWQHVAVTYDGKRKGAGVRIYVNGEPRKIDIRFDELTYPLGSREPFKIGAGGGPENRFQGLIDEVRVYNRALDPDEARILPVIESVSQIAAIPPAKRTPGQALKLTYCYLERFAPAEIVNARRERADTRRARDEFYESIPTVMVMKEMEKPRQAHVLHRGAYDQPGEPVSPGVPAVLPPLKPEWPNNRLGLARWLVDPENPLPARVTVNRLWEMLFGAGLVKTVDDFGSQGEWPVHQELLDWLATEFVRTGWDVKAMLKTMMLSAAYLQASKVTPELLDRDPENRLLARGPRFRLPAAAIRDQALAASGLLVERLGGPSVKPYQPPGLWEELSGARYVPGKGDDLYRRSLYTYWKRTVAPPSMITFDASDRENCTVRLQRTNTPLQALNLMNDVTFVEASRKLAERILKQGGATPAQRLAFAFRTVVARPPSAREAEVLLGALARFRDSFASDPKAAEALLSEGASPRDESLDTGELAAYASLASLVLNLDEAVTRE